MRLGMIGFPQSGKTTVFNALTKGNLPPLVSGGRLEVHTAVVDVPDQRVERLADLFRPVKITYARVTYADVAGLESGLGKKGFPGALLNQLSQMDGLLQVVRCFDDPAVAHSLGRVDPARDLASLDGELLLVDLLTVVRKLERLEQDLRRNANGERARLEREADLFQGLSATLEAETPLRDLDFSVEDQKILAGYGLLTLKPMLVVLNISEGQSPPAIAYPHRRNAVVALQGKLEMELVQLPLEEVEDFKAAYGIQQLGLERVIRHSYDLLGYQSFFTVGEDEVRAWQLRRGATALEAAGVIHTDLQRSFIRAEVIANEELLSLGGINRARERGRLRLEGKDYLLQDGDIMHVRAGA